MKHVSQVQIVTSWCWSYSLVTKARFQTKARLSAGHCYSRLQIWTKSEMQNLPASWRPLGYIYNVSLTTSTNQEKQFGVDLKYTPLHQILKSILGSYIHCQMSTAVSNVKVRLGETSKVVNLKVPCFLSLATSKVGTKCAAPAPVIPTNFTASVINAMSTAKTQGTHQWNARRYSWDPSRKWWTTMKKNSWTNWTSTMSRMHGFQLTLGDAHIVFSVPRVLWDHYMPWRRV